MPADIHLGDDHATDIRPGGFQDAQGLKGLRNRSPAPGGEKDRLIGIGREDPAVGDGQQRRSVDDDEVEGAPGGLKQIDEFGDPISGSGIGTGVPQDRT